MFWQLQLLPASFRGASFYIRAHTETGGRRFVAFEFPNRDAGFTEDLGQRLKVYRMTGYVLGEGYWAARDALRTALNAGGTGTLVHPYFGVLTVGCRTYTCAEDQEDGGRAVFDMDFLDSGVPPSPISVTDTASTLLGALDTMNQVLAGNFGAVLEGFFPGLLPGICVAAIGQALTGLAGELRGALAGLGSASLGLLLPSFLAMSGTPSQAGATAAAVTAAFGAAAAQAVAAANPSVPAYDPLLGDTSAPPNTQDPSWGLAAFAIWSAPAPVGVAPVPVAALAETQAALTTLVQGATIVAVATVYASTTFESANDAQAAQGQLLTMIDAQIEIAADTAQDSLCLAWTALYSAAAQDFAQRVLQLPLLASYDVGVSLPSLVLAQLLYQDSTRSTELEELNSAIHPLFMPSSGVCLAS